MTNSNELTTNINQAARIIEQGGVIAFPTDTFYGLGCNPFNAEAVERIYQIKGRPDSKAILLLIDDLTSIARCTNLSQLDDQGDQIVERFQLLAQHFWPGPLTMVLPAHQLLPDNLVSSNRTVGVRLPDYLPARQLAGAVGGVITATSANLSGASNTRTAAEVAAQLGERLDYILDGGETRGGAPSSVVDITVEPPRLVRAGAIAVNQLVTVLKDLQT